MRQCRFERQAYSVFISGDSKILGGNEKSYFSAYFSIHAR